MSSHRRRVVVTGTSVVTSLGCDVSHVWNQICHGRSGISSIRRFDCSELPVTFGGEVFDFAPNQHMTIEPRTVRRLDRFSQFALVAANNAIAQAGLLSHNLQTPRCGVVVGSALGGLNEIEEQHSRLFDRGPDRVSAFMIPRLIVNAASGNIAVRFGLQGPGSGIAASCASGTQAIGHAYRMIRDGAADVVIAGGAEAPLTPVGITGYSNSGLLSQQNDAPQLACRPFDRDRDGFVLSEGAGVLTLEDFNHAQARKAEILGEVMGFGVSTSVAGHSTSDNATGAARAITNALEDAGVQADSIDYIHAHATGSPAGDDLEADAIRQSLGSHAQKVAVSSTKGQTGHMLGASGAVEAVLCLKAIETGVAPPTLNLDSPAPNHGLNHITGHPRELAINTVMKNSFGIGGHNACLILGAIT